MERVIESARKTPLSNLLVASVALPPGRSDWPTRSKVSKTQHWIVLIKKSFMTKKTRMHKGFARVC